jgi:peptide/nickel transport system substrate-binding protein
VSSQSVKTDAASPKRSITRPGRCARLAIVGSFLVLGYGCGRPSGDLRVAVGYDLASLDPHLDNSFEALEQLSNVYESLVALDRDLRLVPALAASWTNPDATTWSFRLRPGVRFHDGSLLTAEDVVYSIMRLKGDESLTVRAQISEVMDATVENGAVVVRTGRPSARLLNDLAQVLIVRAGSTHESLEAHPNGTGPYAFESWTPRQRLRLRRHEGSWGPRPLHPRVEVQMGVTDEQAAAGLSEGRFMVVAHVGSGSAPNAERVASQSSRYRLVLQPPLFLRHLAFGLSSPTLPGSAGTPNPFRRLEVRQAIDLALDKGRIAAAVSANAVPAAHIVASSVFGYASGASTSTRDVARAGRLLEAAGYRNGFEVALHTPRPSRAADEVKAELGEIGIRVSVVASSSVTDFLSALRNRELAFWIIADGCMTGEAGWLLATQFHSRDTARNLGIENYGGYSNADVDRAIEDANAILDVPTRLAALQRAVRLVEENAWWTPLLYNRAFFIVDRTLVLPPRTDQQLRYAEVVGESP